MKKKGQWQLLFLSPWVLLGLAIFIILLLIGVLLSVWTWIGIALVILGAAMIFQGGNPWWGLIMIIMGVLMIWNPVGRYGLQAFGTPLIKNVLFNVQDYDLETGQDIITEQTFTCQQYQGGDYGSMLVNFYYLDDKYIKGIYHDFPVDCNNQQTYVLSDTISTASLAKGRHTIKIKSVISKPTETDDIDASDIPCPNPDPIPRSEIQWRDKYTSSEYKTNFYEAIPCSAYTSVGYISASGSGGLRYVLNLPDFATTGDISEQMLTHPDMMRFEDSKTIFIGYIEEVPECSVDLDCSNSEMCQEGVCVAKPMPNIFQQFIDWLKLIFANVRWF